MVNQKRIYFNKGMLYGVHNPILHFMLKMFPNNGLLKSRDCNKYVSRRGFQRIKIHEIFRNADSSRPIIFS